MSKESKTLGEVMKAEREAANKELIAAVVKERAEQELLALHKKLKAANDKMLLLQTRKTGVPSGAQSSQQDNSVEEKQRES